MYNKNVEFSNKNQQRRLEMLVP